MQATLSRHINFALSIRLTLAVSVFVGIIPDFCCAQESPLTGTRIELTGDASIELLAIRRKRASNDIAWNPQGQTIPVESSWPAFPKIRGADFRYAFVFKINGLDKARAIAWDTQGVTWSWSDFNTRRDFAGAFSEDGKLSSGDLRLGILGDWGPWQQVSKDGTIENPVVVEGDAALVYQSIKSLVVLGTDLPKVFVNCHGNDGPVNHLSWVVPNAWCEIEAIDIGGVSHSSRGTSIHNKVQVPFFDLREIELKCWRFRLRPVLQWVDYKDVPLVPGQSTVTAKLTTPTAIK